MTFKERYVYNPITDLLGKGGFARVYKANDKLLDRNVALKFYTNNTDNKHTLIQEISKAIQLEHPNLCRYYDAAVIENTNVHGETETIEVGVMEYLEDGDIKTYLTQHPEHLNKLLKDVLYGLSFLHENGIIHRDLKAQNVLIKKTSKGPIAKITDFGISKQIGKDNTSSSVLVGTIEYMAPEQFNPEKYGVNGKVGANMDFWSFGLMAYELLTNKSFFDTNRERLSTAQIMERIMSQEIVGEIESVPEPYREIVKKCLIKSAKLRVQNANELLEIMNVSHISKSDGLQITIGQSSKETQKISSEPPLNFDEQKVKNITATEIKTPKRTKRLAYLAIIALLLVTCTLAFLALPKINGPKANKDDSLINRTAILPITDTLSFGPASNETNIQKNESVAEKNIRPNKNVATKQKVEPKQKIPCYNCQGSGTVFSATICSVCQGQKKEDCNSFITIHGIRSHCEQGFIKCTDCGGDGYCTNDYKKGSGKCQYCRGTGRDDGKECILCDGDGHCNLCDGSGDCLACKGTGEKKCKNCRGQGSVTCSFCKGSGSGGQQEQACPVCKVKRNL